MSYKQNFRDVGAPDTFLSNFSVSYWQDTSLFVGTRYFPVVPVNQAAGKFLTYPKGYFGRPVNSKRAEDGVANTIGYKTRVTLLMTMRSVSSFLTKNVQTFRMVSNWIWKRLQ